MKKSIETQKLLSFESSMIIVKRYVNFALTGKEIKENYNIYYGFFVSEYSSLLINPILLPTKVLL